MQETAGSVAVLGLGTMGGRVAVRLSAVRPVRGYDPDPAAGARAAAAGITACATARAAVEGADLVVLSLPRPAHVPGAADALGLESTVLVGIRSAAWWRRSSQRTARGGSASSR
jgi:3-hydroxyisobutyrate dehydrogenase-like beta-hydroxyacid dehydrogenase